LKNIEWIDNKHIKQQTINKPASLYTSHRKSVDFKKDKIKIGVLQSNRKEALRQNDVSMS